MNQKRQGVLIVISVLCILVVMSIGIYNYNVTVRTQLRESARDTLSESTTQQQLSFESEIETEKKLLQGISRTVTYLGNETETFTGYLSMIESHHKFENITVSDEEGVGISSNGNTVNLKDEKYFDDVMAGQSAVVGPVTSKFSEKNVVAMAVPVIGENATVTGVMMAEYSVEYLNSILNPTFSGKGYSFVVTPDGEVLAQSLSNYTIATNGDLYGVLDFAVFESGETAREIAAQILDGQAGGISYEYEGETRFAEYRLLDINDWILLAIVPAEVAEHDAEIIVYETTAFNLVIFVGCGLLLLCIMVIRSSYMREIERVAYYDPLTGIPNLNKFKQLIFAEMRKNPDVEFTIVKMDVVNFKAINEMFDFEAGNKVISAIAEVGKSSQSPHFIQARSGVDEFLLFSAREYFEDLAESRIYFESKLHDLVDFVARDSINFRYGRYNIKKGETDVNAIVDRVTLAHANAKKEKNTPVYDYDEKIMNTVIRNAELTSKMDNALSSREFKLYLQPKYRIKDNVVVGSEALVRWQESDGTMVFPNDFIPLFEQNGFIVELDKYMLEEVCAVLRSWMDEGIECVPISVNFSRLHLTNPMFIFELERITDRYHVPRKYIEIELTENTMLENDGDEFEAVVEKLHASGFVLSMDDFGSGYSSLGMLKDLDVDFLKMDRSFFVNNKYHERGQIVVESVIRMAQDLKISTVAEGVETIEQVDFLKEIGCDIAQGYYYAKPMPVEDFKKHCWGR